MAPHSFLCNQLFSAVNRTNHFKDLKTFYFHNCIYDWLYHDSSCRQSDYTDTEYILRTYSPEYRVIIVGDASMAPYELTRTGGIIDWNLHNDLPGIEWLRRIRNHFEYSVWLNPIPRDYWEWMDGAFTIRKIGEIFPMDELTVDGLERSINKLRSRKAVQAI